MLRAEPGHVEYQTAPSGPVRTPWGRRQEWATWNTRAPDKDGLVGYASERQMWSGEFIYGATSTVAWGLLPTGPLALAEPQPDNPSKPD